MATFHKMASMMKNMNPEDAMAVIGLIQSGRLKLQENEHPDDPVTFRSIQQMVADSRSGGGVMRETGDDDDEAGRFSRQRDDSGYSSQYQPMGPRFSHRQDERRSEYTGSSGMQRPEWQNELWQREQEQNERWQKEQEQSERWQHQRQREQELQVPWQGLQREQEQEKLWQQQQRGPDERENQWQGLQREQRLQRVQGLQRGQGLQTEQGLQRGQELQMEQGLQMDQGFQRGQEKPRQWQQQEQEHEEMQQQREQEQLSFLNEQERHRLIALKRQIGTAEAGNSNTFDMLAQLGRQLRTRKMSEIASRSQDMGDPPFHEGSGYQSQIGLSEASGGLAESESSFSRNVTAVDYNHSSISPSSGIADQPGTTWSSASSHSSQNVSELDTFIAQRREPSKQLPTMGQSGHGRGRVDGDGLTLNTRKSLGSEAMSSPQSFRAAKQIAEGQPQSSSDMSTLDMATLQQMTRGLPPADVQPTDNTQYLQQALKMAQVQFTGNTQSKATTIDQALGMSQGLPFGGATPGIQFQGQSTILGAVSLGQTTKKSVSDVLSKAFSSGGAASSEMAEEEESRKRKLQEELSRFEIEVEVSSKQRRIDNNEKTLQEIRPCKWCTSTDHDSRDCHLLDVGRSSKHGPGQDALSASAGTSEEPSSSQKTTTSKDDVKSSSGIRSTSKDREQRSPKVDKALRDRARRELDLKIQSFRNKSFNEIKNEIETDSSTLALRLHDIDACKQIPEYNNYRKKIQRHKRDKANDPQTPDIFKKCSHGSWDDLLTDWQKALHRFDASSDPNSTPSLMSLSIHPVKCTPCNTTAATAELLEKHIADGQHKKRAIGPGLCFKCTPCNFRFRDIKDYKRHIAVEAGTYTKTTTGQSKDSSVPGTSTGQTSAPPVVNQKQETTTYSCVVCRYSSSDKKTYGKHFLLQQHKQQLWAVKKIPQPKYHCIRCDVRCHETDAMSFQQHLESSGHYLHLPIVDYNRVCSVCHKVMSGAIKEYVNHIDKEHHLEDFRDHITKDGPQQYSCTLCNFDCADSFLYEIHNSTEEHRNRIAHTPVEKLPRCDACLETFESTTDLTNHIKTEYHLLVQLILESKVNLAQCSVCNDKFNDLVSFGDHLKDRVHIWMMELYQNIQCILCGWNYKDSRDKKTNQGSKEYLNHIDVRKHITQIENMQRVFGTAKNLHSHTVQSDGDYKTVGSQKQKKVTSKVLVKGLKRETTTGLRTYFSLFGPVVRVQIFGENTPGFEPYGIVTFGQVDVATAVVKRMRHRIIGETGSWFECVRYDWDLEILLQNIEKQLSPSSWNVNEPPQVCTISVDKSSADKSTIKNIKEFFSQFGCIRQARQMNERMNVTFWDMSACIEALDWADIEDGSTFKLERYIQPEEKGVFDCTVFFTMFGTLDDADEEALSFYFDQYGTVKRCQVQDGKSSQKKENKRKIDGHCVFASVSSAQRAYRKGTIRGSASVHSYRRTFIYCYVPAAYVMHPRQIWVKGVPDMMREATIKKHFARYGLETIKIIKDYWKGTVKQSGKQYALLTFSNKRNVDSVMKREKVDTVLRRYYKCIPHEAVIRKAQTTKSKGGREGKDKPTKVVASSKNQKTEQKDKSNGKLQRKPAISPKERASGSDMNVVDEWFEGDLEDRTNPDVTDGKSLTDAGGEDTIRVIQQPGLVTNIPILSSSQPDIPGVGNFGPKRPELGISAPGVVLLQGSPMAGIGQASSVPLKFKVPEADSASKPTRGEPGLGVFKVPCAISASKPSTAKQDPPRFKVPDTISTSKSSAQNQSSTEFKVPGSRSSTKKDEGAANPFKMPQSLTYVSGLKKNRVLHGILGEETSKTVKPFTPPPPSTFVLSNLAADTKEGHLWQYFKKLGIGEVQSVYVSKKKAMGWVKLSGIGLKEAKLLVRKHNIKGKKVSCTNSHTGSSSSNSAASSTTTSTSDESADEFAKKIASILASNPGWSGNSRGIEYVAAGFACDVCNWFYKSEGNLLLNGMRVTHKNSAIHKNDKISRDMDAYGVEGVFCKACKEFVTSEDGNTAMSMAYDHCKLLKHHLHVKLDKLQSNQRLPKWLLNPLYVEVKKLIKPSTETFIKSPQHFKTPEPLMKSQRSKGVSVPAKKQPQEVVSGVSGLNLVHYGSSDEENSDEEDEEKSKTSFSLKDIISGKNDDVAPDTGDNDEDCVILADDGDVNLYDEMGAVSNEYDGMGAVNSDEMGMVSNEWFTNELEEDEGLAIPGLNDAPLSFNTS